MFKVNDYIMYGMTGVCQVVDITKESFIDNLQKEYYVLKYIYSNDSNWNEEFKSILKTGDIENLVKLTPCATEIKSLSSSLFKFLTMAFISAFCII